MTREPYIVHLPQGSPYFIGREEELAVLQDFWGKSHPRVIAITGLGGIGKTALVSAFLHRITRGDLERPSALFVWSFYESQDTDRFFAELYTYLTREQAQNGSWSSFDMVVRAATECGHGLIVLDGLERVQVASEPNFGALQEAQLARFLRYLSEGLGGMQCLITTRFPMALGQASPSTASIALAELNKDAACQLLRQSGVVGSDSTLEAVLNQYGGHPLTLQILGNYLRSAADGDARRALQLPLTEVETTSRQEAFLSRTLRAVEKRLTQEEIALLSRICLFRNSVSVDVLHGIFATPQNPDMSGPIAGLAKWQYVQLARRLEQLGLLSVSPDGGYRVHPIIRDYFSRAVVPLPDVHQELAHHYVGLLGERDSDRPVSEENSELILEVIDHMTAARAFGHDQIRMLAQRLSPDESPTARAYSMLLDFALTIDPGSSARVRNDQPPKPRVFISYVREDSTPVGELRSALEAAGIDVWQDKDRLVPGKRWKAEIRQAIHDGDFFLACFSEAYWNRSRTYMNEEITVAVEELRLRSREVSWFLPVLLSECLVPEIDIGAGETLRDLQHVDLNSDWTAGIKALTTATMEMPDR